MGILTEATAKSDADMCSTEKFGTISKVKKKILFDSVMLLLGVYLAKRIKRTCIYIGLAIWKIIMALLTKAKHLS